MQLMRSFSRLDFVGGDGTVLEGLQVRGLPQRSRQCVDGIGWLWCMLAGPPAGYWLGDWPTCGFEKREMRQLPGQWLR
jgi:hypothetical protein